MPALWKEIIKVNSVQKLNPQITSFIGFEYGKRGWFEFSGGGKPKSVPEKGVWNAGLITAVHTCFVANREIIYVTKGKVTAIFWPVNKRVQIT